MRFRLKQYLQAAAQKAPRLRERRVSPHTLRHTAAVHLLASGVDVTIIRDWMGHVSLDTTNLYAQADLETKRRTLEKADGVLRPTPAPRWKRDADLLAWLDASEPVAHGQGDIAPTCRWPVRRNYDEQKRS